MNKKSEKLASQKQPRLESIERILRANSVSMYLNEIDKIPLLTRDEELEYSKQAARGSLEAKERLIISNLRFVVSIAKKYQGFGIPLSDLISEGNLGLINSVDKFDYKKGFHFISYAIWWIKQSIMKAISEKSRLVRLPMNRTNELMHIWKFIEEYTKKNSKKPNEEIIAKELGMEKNEVKKILEFSQSHSSLDEMYYDDDSTHEELVCDSYFTEDNCHPEDIVMRGALHEGINKILNKLPDRERKIIEYRFGLNGEEPQSLSSIGDKLNLTKERIRQIEQWAINELRKNSESNNLHTYLN